jgi:hypothetical protein
VGFPLGYSTCGAKLEECILALKDGANEIDMVINITDVKNKDYKKVEDEIRKIKETIGNHILKVIIETCYLTTEEKIEMGNNLSLKGQTDLRKDIIKETKCNGVIMHLNRSCKMCDFLQYEIGKDLEESLNIPITTFDGDQADPRNYSKAQYETRIEALVEMIEQRSR